MADEQQTVAVVVAHGIGDQLPMDTVRALVDNVFGTDSGLKDPAPVYSRLHRGADFSDLRRLVLAKSGDRPRVDFHELYWQATFGVGSPGSVLGWALRLLRRRPVGKQFRHIVLTVRLVLCVLVVIALAVAWAALSWLDPESWWGRVLSVAAPLLVAAGTVAKLLVKNVLASAVADASRWFSPGPGDIESRDKVRALGVDLLKELHRPGADGKPRYGRIVVIAHSLGAVVTYDAIRLAFDELREPTPLALPPRGPAERRQPHAWAFATAEPGEPPFLDASGQAVVRQLAGAAYHRLQTDLQAEQRSMGVAWRVTDFITVGSPLTHAADLLSSKNVSFARRMRENELPGCPPLGEQQNRERAWAASRPRKAVQLAAGTKGTGRVAFYREQEDGPLIAHEASPFATTRWTNLYFPMTRWLAGDPVGGPAADVFGRGVVDTEVEVSAPDKERRKVMRWPVRAHTWYWHRVDRGSGNADKDCIDQLREAMELQWA